MMERTLRILLKASYPLILALLAVLVVDYYLWDERLTPWLIGVFAAICVALVVLAFVPTPHRAEPVTVNPVPTRRFVYWSHRRKSP